MFAILIECIRALVDLVSDDHFNNLEYENVTKSKTPEKEFLCYIDVKIL